MRLAVICSVVALAASACAAPPAPAPEPPPPSTAVRDSLRSAFDTASTYVTRAAEQVPEARYSYRPTPEVRTLGELFAHIAQANNMICGASSGQAAPEATAAEAPTKADIQKALADSVAFCQAAFDAVDDTAGGEPLRLFDAIDSTRLGALAFNTAHLMEHYGNVVTYMRLNKMVPPSSM